MRVVVLAAGLALALGAVGCGDDEGTDAEGIGGDSTWSCTVDTGIGPKTCVEANIDPGAGCPTGTEGEGCESGADGWCEVGTDAAKTATFYYGLDGSVAAGIEQACGMGGGTWGS